MVASAAGAADGGKGRPRCCPANEVQHENLPRSTLAPRQEGAASERAHARALTGARRKTRCGPVVKAPPRRGVIKPNVNCVIAPGMGATTAVTGGHGSAVRRGTRGGGGRAEAIERSAVLQPRRCLSCPLADSRRGPRRAETRGETCENVRPLPHPRHSPSALKTCNALPCARHDVILAIRRSVDR